MAKPRAARRRRREGQVRRAAGPHRRLPDADRRCGRQRARRRQGRAEDGGEVDRRARLARRRDRRRRPIKGVVGENLRKALDWLPHGRRLVTVATDCDLSGHVAGWPALDALALREVDRPACSTSTSASASSCGARSWKTNSGHGGRAGRRGGLRRRSPPGHGAGAAASAGAPLRDHPHARAARRLDRAPARRAAGRARHRDRFARPDARAHRRHLVRGAAGRGRLRAAGAQLRRRARAAAARRGAGRAEALARGRGRRPRSARTSSTTRMCSPTTASRCAATPRHAAAELRARGAQAAQPGEPGRAPPRPQGPDLRRRVRQGRATRSRSRRSTSSARRVTPAKTAR